MDLSVNLEQQSGIFYLLACMIVLRTWIPFDYDTTNIWSL